MIVTFVYPSSGEETGGVMVLYEFANALSRLGHDVRFFHGPAWPGRVDRIDQLPDLCHRDGVQNIVVDDLTDPSLPSGDIIFAPSAPRRLGLPATLVQGFRMLSDEFEERAFRAIGPKVCVASWLQDVGVSYGSDRRQLFHVPNGIDHRIFTPHRPLDDRPLDVAGLFHPHHSKGWDVLVAALDRLRSLRPEHRAAVFGRRTPSTLPVGAEVVSSPDHAQLAGEVYSGTKVFVQASRVEGFGLTAVEAMACGAALVTTDCGGSRDYAIHDETAVVVAPEDHRALATAVDALLDDEPRRQRLATAGMALVRTEFDWDRSGPRLAEILERYLADPEPLLVPPGEPEGVTGRWASSPPHASSPDGGAAILPIATGIGRSRSEVSWLAGLARTPPARPGRS